MREVKYRAETFSFYDHTGIVRHLERMALKGWLLESRNSLFWKYRHTEPGKVHFAVTYFPNASEFDPEPSEKQQTFFAFCERAGWKHVVSFAQMQIFMNEQENPVPIETDALVQVQNIHQAMKKNFMVSQILLLFIGVLQLVLFTYRLHSDPIGVLASNTNLFTGFCWGLVILLCLVELVSYFKWYHRAKTVAEQDGRFMETHGHQRLQLISIYIVFGGLLLWFLSIAGTQEGVIGGISLLYVSAVMLLVLLIKNGLKKLKIPTGINRTVTIASSFILSFSLMGVVVWLSLGMARNGWLEREPAETYVHKGRTRNVYKDELPLTIEDMIDGIDKSKYSYEMREEESFLLAQYEGTQRGKLGEGTLPDLKYTITKVKLQMLYEVCLNHLVEKYTDEEEIPEIQRDHLEELDASVWGADAVWQRYSGDIPMHWYLMCIEDKIVEIVFYWEDVTEEQMRKAVEQLRIV